MFCGKCIYTQPAITNHPSQLQETMECNPTYRAFIGLALAVLRFILVSRANKYVGILVHTHGPNIQNKLVSRVFFHCWNALLPSEVWICSLVKAIFLVKPTIFPGQIHIFWVNHSSPHVFDVAKSLLRRCLQSETIQFAQHGILGDSDGKLDFALVEQFHGNVEIWWAITSKSPANKKDIGTPSR